MNIGFLGPAVATVLTVYGIETCSTMTRDIVLLTDTVATVLTVYGIETHSIQSKKLPIRRLQQYLPFTVLKRNQCIIRLKSGIMLQQYLSFTVLKLLDDVFEKYWFCVATVLTLYGIETEVLLLLHMPNGYLSRNSTYHLRY